MKCLALNEITIPTSVIIICFSVFAIIIHSSLIVMFLKIACRQLDLISMIILKKLLFEMMNQKIQVINDKLFWLYLRNRKSYQDELQDDNSILSKSSKISEMQASMTNLGVLH